MNPYFNLAGSNDVPSDVPAVESVDEMLSLESASTQMMQAEAAIRSLCGMYGLMSDTHMSVESSGAAPGNLESLLDYVSFETGLSMEEAGGKGFFTKVLEGIKNAAKAVWNFFGKVVELITKNTGTQFKILADLKTKAAGIDNYPEKVVAGRSPIGSASEKEVNHEMGSLIDHVDGAGAIADNIILLQDSYIESMQAVIEARDKGNDKGFIDAVDVAVKTSETLISKTGGGAGIFGRVYFENAKVDATDIWTHLGDIAVGAASKGRVSSNTKYTMLLLQVKTLGSESKINVINPSADGIGKLVDKLDTLKPILEKATKDLEAQKKKQENVLKEIDKVAKKSGFMDAEQKWLNATMKYYGRLPKSGVAVVKKGIFDYVRDCRKVIEEVISAAEKEAKASK